MNFHCLSKNDLESFLNNILHGAEIEDNILNILVENCRTYEGYLTGLTYFVAQIVDRRLKKSIHTSMFVSEVYQLQNHVAFEVQEFDNDFVDFLLRNKREKSLNLEEELIDIQNRISDHQYVKNFRF